MLDFKDPESSDATQVMRLISGHKENVVARLQRDFPKHCYADFEDVWQQVLLAGWDDRIRLAGLAPDALVPWLCVVGRHFLVNDARRTRSRKSAEAMHDSRRVTESQPGCASNEQPPRPEFVFDESSLPDWLMRALGRLTAVEREIVRLHFWHGMSVVEIAESLESRRTTVSSRLTRILTKLQDVLPHVPKK